MIRRAKSTVVAIAVELALVLGAHALLLRWFAEGEVASVLFTGGHAVSLGTLLGAGLFFLVRLTLYLVLPGVILAQLAGLVGRAGEAAPIEASPIEASPIEASPVAAGPPPQERD